MDAPLHAVPRSLSGDIREPLASTFTLFLLQVLVILLFSRLISDICKLAKQPTVVGEMIAGILLGPTALGKIPGWTSTLFPSFSLDTLSIVASFGLCFFMLSVGMEMDIPSVTRNWRQCLLLAMLGLLGPAAASYGLAVLFSAPAYSSANVGVLGLFLTCCLGIISLPVLARILKERQVDVRLQELVLSVAVVEDIFAYILLAIVTVLMKPSVGSDSIGIIVGATVAESLLVFIPLRAAVDVIVARAQALNKQLDAGTFLFLIVCLIICSLLTNIIGLSFMIGAFQMGMIIPRTSGLAHQISEKVEFFSTTVLMPIYFATSGLKTDFSKINTAMSWGLTILLVVSALLSKGLSVYVGCHIVSVPPLMSRVVSALMTCKGLIALVVINVGLDAKAITQEFFSILVLMVIVCTVGTTPLVSLMDWLSKKEDTEREMAAYSKVLEERERQEQGKLPPPIASTGGSGAVPSEPASVPLMNAHGEARLSRRFGRSTRGMSLAGSMLPEELLRMKAQSAPLDEGGPESAGSAAHSTVVWASSPAISSIARSTSIDRRSGASSFVGGGGGGGGGSSGGTPELAGTASGSAITTPLQLPLVAPLSAVSAPPLPGLSLLGAEELHEGKAGEEGAAAPSAEHLHAFMPATPKHPLLLPRAAMPAPRFRISAAFSDPVSVAPLIAVSDLFSPLPEVGQPLHGGASLTAHWLQGNLDMPSALVAGVGLEVLDKERHEDMFNVLSSSVAARTLLPAETSGPLDPPSLSLEASAATMLASGAAAEGAHVALEVAGGGGAPPLTPVPEEASVVGEDEGVMAAGLPLPAPLSALSSSQRTPEHAALQGQHGSAFFFEASLSSGPWQDAQVHAAKEAAQLLLVTSRFPVASQGGLELTSMLIGQVMKDMKSAFKSCVSL